MAKNDKSSTLPVWDLNDLYPGMESQALKDDFEDARRKAAAFKAAYEGKVARLSGRQLAAAIAEYEAIDQTLSRIMSYAGLMREADVNDAKIAKFYQACYEEGTVISRDTLFFTLELNRIDEISFKATMRDKDLQFWQSWLDRVRAEAPHQLSDELEKALLEKSVSGRGAWHRMFDLIMAEMRIPVDGKMLTESECLNLMSGADPDLRREAHEAFGKALGDRINQLGLIFNTLVIDKKIEDGWRHFDRPDGRRNLSNHVEDEVVDALVSAVKGSYPKLSHRYYAWKAQALGGTKLDYWDRNAPLDATGDANIPWDSAVDTVVGAYRRFSGRLADEGQKFFDHPWIDAAPREGKNSGAFSHPTVPDAHPYILMNYHGKRRDVMTLAHELGHGVHQLLAAGQGHFNADTPLTVAETASVFGEMLTFRAMLDAETDPDVRRDMLAGKIEDMLNTVVRQISFYDFEMRVHRERQSGEVTPERMGEIWMDVMRESLGPALEFGPGYENYWSYIPHMVHTPFYVYAYAFGDCLVNALYTAYTEEAAKGPEAAEAFVEQYLEMLAAGGSRHHSELLAPFGLDASDPAFWQKGLKVIEELMDELEALGPPPSGRSAPAGKTAPAPV